MAAKTRKKRVIIVGGGFGGLETAKALESADVEILLVDRLSERAATMDDHGLR